MKRRQWLLYCSLATLAACADTDHRRGPGRGDGGWGGRPGQPTGPGPHGGPGYGGPGYGAPGYGAPGYGAPGYGAPGQPGVGFGPDFVRGRVLRVTGTVGYQQRIMLPPTSTLIVRVIDLTQGDDAPNMIGERFIPVDRRAPPLPYEVDIDTRRILDPRLARLVITAEIVVEGRTRFASGRYPVLTGGAGARVDMLVMPVSQPSS